MNTTTGCRQFMWNTVVVNRTCAKILIVGLAALACAARGAQTGAQALLPPDSASVFRLNASAGEFAKMSIADVKGQPFLKSMRVEVIKKPQRTQDVQITAPVDAAMASGDVLMISFWMRSAAAGEATLDAGFRTVPGATAPPAAPRAAGPPAAQGAAGGAGAAARGRGMFFGQPALNTAAVAGAAWKKVQFPFALTRAYNKGEAEVFFTLGYRS